MADTRIMLKDPSRCKSTPIAITSSHVLTEDDLLTVEEFQEQHDRWIEIAAYRVKRGQEIQITSKNKFTGD